MEKRKSGETEVFKDDNCDNHLTSFFCSCFFLAGRLARLHAVGVFSVKIVFPAGGVVTRSGIKNKKLGRMISERIFFLSGRAGIHYGTLNDILKQYIHRKKTHNHRNFPHFT